MADSFDWRTSPPHITLLETFARPRRIQFWAPWEETAIELFIQSGALVPASAVGAESLYQCSDLGQKAIHEFKEARKLAKESVQRQVMELLVQNKLAEAFEVHERYIKTIFRDYDGSYQKNRLDQLLARTPRILLDQFGQRDIHIIRAIAGMKLLWRELSVVEWIPEYHRLDNKTVFNALEILHRNARLQRQLKEKPAGSAVRICFPEGTTRACSSCRTYQDQVFHVSDFPEWPFEGCLHPTGCEPRLKWV